MRILVVDDDPNTRRAICSLLELEGHVAEMAEHAREAWERLLAGTYDLLITDQVMPGQPGLDLAREAVTAALVRRAIVVSGQVVPGNVESAAIRWLSKPLDFDRLLDTIGSAVEAPAPT